jgi:cytochrome c
MEFNKIAGAVLGTLLLMMIIGKVGNTLVPEFHPPKDAPGHEAAPQTPQTAEPEKPLPELLAAADPKAGEQRARACTSCHSFEKGGPNKVGPDLWNIVGRKKGSHEGFAYSDALKNAGGEWTYEDIFKFIGNPAGMYPGTKMAFRLSSAEQRAQVIAYLRTLSDSPKPLPAVEKKSETPAPKPDEKKAEPEKKPEQPTRTDPKPAEAPKPAEPPKAAEPPKPAEPGKPAAPPAEEKKN